KKRKIDEHDKTIPKERLQCEFFLERKQRRCAMTRRPDIKYCAEHATFLNQNERLKLKDVRVPCPLDGTHSVWEGGLKRHLKKCQQRKLLQEKNLKERSWFKENLNSNCDYKTDTVVNILEQEYSQDKIKKFIKEVAIPKLKFFQEEISYRQSYNYSKILNSRFEEKIDQKHILQQSSILGHLNDLSLLDKRNLFIEFGCGRAELSRYLSRSLIVDSENQNCNFNNINFALIDRSPSRLKMDKKFVEDYREIFPKSVKNEENQINVQRFKIDIKDLNLDAMIQQNFPQDIHQIVGISKHLCGSATDLTLSCCFLHSNVVKEKFGGMLIAMCCRHSCSYDDLLPDSKKYLMENFQVDKTIFDIVLKKLTSWATCGGIEGKSIPCENSDEDKVKFTNTHFSGLDYAERLEIGLFCRRIIDESRKFALTKMGYNVELINYCQREVSLENQCMII
ncbi:hypothetical protein PACTADRAFT_24107, partial [Pachysolen tannophilus NRRL Y-2460]